MGLTDIQPLRHSQLCDLVWHVRLNLGPRLNNAWLAYCREYKLPDLSPKPTRRTDLEGFCLFSPWPYGDTIGDPEFDGWTWQGAQRQCMLSHVAAWALGPKGQEAAARSGFDSNELWQN